MDFFKNWISHFNMRRILKTPSPAESYVNQLNTRPLIGRPTQFNFLGKKYIGGNWCGQTWIVSLLSNFKYQNSLQLINEKVLFVFYLLTLCNCLLILWEFLSWKKIFWHHPNISPGLTWKNTLLNWQHILFIWTWNVWMMSDAVNISNLFHVPFMVSWPPKEIVFITLPKWGD